MGAANGTSLGGSSFTTHNRTAHGEERQEQQVHMNRLPDRLPSSNHFHEYTKIAQEFLKKQKVKKAARDRNLNLHGKLIKSSVGLDIKSLVLKQSSKEKSRYYPRFKYSSTEDIKISIYYWTTQVTNSEGVPLYFTIPAELPPAGIIEKEEGKEVMYEKIKSTSFKVEKYEGMPLFNATMNYFPCVITVELQKKPSVGSDGVSDYQNLITYWVFTINKSSNLLELKPFRQVLVAYDIAFLLQQIYGITDAVEGKDGEYSAAGNDDSQIWVACMTEEKNTVVMPCGHLWVCKECATTIASQRSPDWPICRNKVTSFVPLNINSIKNMEKEGIKEGSEEIGEGVQL